jgi:hypothetical protein
MLLPSEVYVLGYPIGLNTAPVQFSTALDRDKYVYI